MNLEGLLYQSLSADPALSSLLTAFNNSPAVFELFAPEDDDPGWTGAQTPRIEFFVNREEDPERRVSGQISVFIIHEDTSNETAAMIENEIRRLLDGATFRPDEGTITLQWNSAELFDEDPKYRGIELVFDLIAWPSGLTYAPDPVQAFRDWAAAKWAALQVDPLTWAPTDSSPALYWRLADVEDVEMTSWGAWITGRFQGHILAQSPSVRVEWIRRVSEGLALDRKLNLGDGSCIFVQRLQANSDADPLRTGQIRVQAQFGVLKPVPVVPTINNANISEGV